VVRVPLVLRLPHASRAPPAGSRIALVGRLGPAPARAVAGLAIGDDSEQPPELTESMRRSGLSHLTAVSGRNDPKGRLGTGFGSSLPLRGTNDAGGAGVDVVGWQAKVV
jgi:hypothetical protein